MQQLRIHPPQELLRAIEINEFAQAAEAAMQGFPDQVAEEAMQGSQGIDQTSDDSSHRSSHTPDASDRIGTSSSQSNMLDDRAPSLQDDWQFNMSPGDSCGGSPFIGGEDDHPDFEPLSERGGSELSDDDIFRERPLDHGASTPFESEPDIDDPDRVHLFNDNSDASDGGEEETVDSNEGSEAGSVAMEDEGAAVQDRAPIGPASSRHGQDLFDQLAQGYRPGRRPRNPPNPETSPLAIMDRLTPSEEETLRHIRTSIRTGATMEQYRQFGKDKMTSNPDITIYGKDRATALVKRVTGLKSFSWDMCPESCMAFVGPHQHLQHCTAKRKGRRCGAARYDEKGKPRRQFTTLSILPRIRAKFASGSGSTYLHDQAEWSADRWNTDEYTFADWSDGAVHRNLRARGFFEDPRHDAFILSTDGAQIVDKRKSNGWIVLLTSLNTLHTERFKRPETFISTIVPGPNNPVDLDSFLWPILAQFARAGRGYWVWDGARREWFLWKAWVVAAAADQPGSSKINHMTGATGYAGCKTCHIVANYAYEGDSTGYFPLKTIYGDEERAEDRPDEYDPYELPLRTDESYEEDLAEFENSLTAADRAEARRMTGVGGRPLLTFSPAFTMPTFFSIDVFHLFGSNIPTLLWSTLTKKSDPDDPFTLSDEQQDLFASVLQKSEVDLPSSFSSSPPRDPKENAGKHYKIYEWTLITYLYLPSFLYAIGAPLDIIQMMSHLQAGVRLAMSSTGCPASQLSDIQDHFVKFVRLWEQGYVRGEPHLLHRATTSIHQLLHVWMFVYCIGSVRNTSQARCEREIGLVKRALRSFKSPFAGIIKRVTEQEHLRLLNLLLKDDEEEDQEEGYRLSTVIRTRHHRMTASQARDEHSLIENWREGGYIPTPLPAYIYRGKLQVPGRKSIRGSRIEVRELRKACRFVAETEDGLVYGEAIHFICFLDDNQNDAVVDLDDEEGDGVGINPDKALVFFKMLEDVTSAEGIIKGRWGRHAIVNIAAVLEPIAVFELAGWIYVLRHLCWLTDHDDP
ncbi:hypothetical protein CF326_g7931 [Tilletia indica]|nr:hypothetical protein CF326_g7931 [Tilletia indica]